MVAIELGNESRGSRGTFGVSPGARAETIGVADFAGDEAKLGISPTVSAGVGLRIFDDEWDVALTHVEVVLQQRFGIADQEPQVYLRFSRAVPRVRRERTPHPDAPGGLPPTPRWR